MPSQTWQGKDFSMRPVDPATVADNPCTLTLNMFMDRSGLVRKRRRFEGTGLPGGVRNHLLAEADGKHYLLIKTGATVQRYVDGAGPSTLISPASDPPIGTIQAASRGSFAINGRDIYYCDGGTIFRWTLDPTLLVTARPGVFSLAGHDYVTLALAKMPAGNGTPANTYTSYGPPFGPVENAVGQPGRPDPSDNTMSPRIIFPSLPPGNGNPQDVLAPAEIRNRGEKILNTSFALSWYDPARRTFGRRTAAFALPYLFSGGPKSDSSIPEARDILSAARTQYAKVIQTPSASATPPGFPTPIGGNHSEYKVAVWFTRGFFPAANTSGTVGGGWWAFALWVPAMSVHMNDLLFLEKIADAGVSDTLAEPTGIGTNGGVICGKDDTRIYASGRYLDTYARPVPSKFMAILPNGTAVYFYPLQIPTLQAEIDADLTGNYTGFLPGNYLEYSVGHPEQIGRNTEEQRDTISAITGLRGDPLAAFSSLILTAQGIFSIGFQKDIIIEEVVGSRGCRNPTSIQQSSAGIFYYSDDGIIWLRGDRSVLIDKAIGFGHWYDNLTAAERDSVVIGSCDSLSHLLIFSKVASGTDTAGVTGDRALCYDHELEFASEFRGSDVTGIDYATFYRLGTGQKSQLWTNTGRYPDSLNSVVIAASRVETWISEKNNIPKTLGFLEIHLGPRDGTINVTVTAYNHPDQTTEYSAATVSRTVAIASGSSGIKVRIPTFLGLRGRMFKITLEPINSAVDWGLQSVMIQWDEDETEDARSL
jgi:hypothetical protein